KMFVWPSGWIPAISPRRSAIPPSGCVRTTQWALSSKATTPIWSRAVMAAAARRIASLPMSTFLTPCIGEPEPRSHELQLQEALDPGGQLFRDQRVDLLALRLECPDELLRDLLVAGQDQDARLAVDDRVGVGAVVLAERVSPRLDDGTERVEARLGRLHQEA